MFRRKEIYLALATNARPDYPVCSIFTAPTELAQLLVITVAHQLDFTCCVIILTHSKNKSSVCTVRSNDEH